MTNLVKITEKVKSFFRNMPGIEKNVDEYLTDNLSSLLIAYKIARKTDLEDTVVDIEKKEETVEELLHWKDKTKPRVTDIEKRIGRLETKYGVK